VDSSKLAERRGLVYYNKSDTLFSGFAFGQKNEKSTVGDGPV